MANPPNVSYCKIVGNFKALIADSIFIPEYTDPETLEVYPATGDVDDLPDFVSMVGVGTITPDFAIGKVIDVGIKSTLYGAPIPVTVDEDGDLSQGGRKYVMVLTPSAPVKPLNFSYTITLSLGIEGIEGSRTYGPLSFNVIPGGTVDLIDIMPVPTSSGEIIVQGPQGIQGPQGATGPVGPAVPIKGVVATSTALPSTGNVKGDGYLTTDTGNLWVHSGTAFVNGGPVRGPKGDAGADSNIAGPVGPQGLAGIAGLKGDKGDKGDTGAALNIKGSVPAAGSLPVSNMVEGDGWITTDNGHLYIYNAVTWIDVGLVQGPQGVAGETGPVGPQGEIGPQGDIGPAGPEGAAGPAGSSGLPGATGPQGPMGDEGPIGGSVLIKGNVATSSALPSSGNVLGDAYITNDTGNVWTYNGTTFIGSGPVRGPVGPVPNFTIGTVVVGTPVPVLHNITVGTVTQGPTASVTLTGAAPNQVLNIVLPVMAPASSALAMTYALIL